MRLLAIDGNSIINRAFYGVRNLSASDGTPTNAIFGFMNILRKLISDFSPDGLCVCFDRSGPTFRHKAFDFYKAQRQKMPEELAVQLPILKNILKAMNINCYEMDGYEADDLLGTIAEICRTDGDECIIVTGDKDSFQLISQSTEVCHIKTKAGHTEYKVYDTKSFFDEYGFSPEKMIDLKALMGDSSDNIPGVPGIGEKTATDFLRQYESLEYIYSNINDLNIRETLKTKLIAGRESAENSYWLATIFRQVPIEFSVDNNIINSEYSCELYDLLSSLGLKKIIDAFNVSKHEKKSETSETVITSEMINISDENIKILEHEILRKDYVSFYSEDIKEGFSVFTGERLFVIDRINCMSGYTDLLSNVLSDKIKKVSTDIKSIISCALAEGIQAGGFIFDVSLGAYILSPTDNGYKCERLAEIYGISEKHPAEILLKLFPIIETRLFDTGARSLYYDVELPLCKVLAEMENNGFLVDRNALQEFGEFLDRQITINEEKIYEYSGKHFNINSTKQLGEVLFDELMLPTGKKTKSGWSTSAEVLEKLRNKHPVVEHIIEYRMLTKLKSTYVDGLSSVIKSDGRIHTNFQMTVTATGRLSSTEPNLQNIPIRKQLGSEIRKMFIAEKGNVLIDADYSQIELRILAHISSDDAMCDAFLSGEDFHAVTASKVFGVELSDVTSDLRSKAKAVNFGIIYGMSAFSLAQDIHVSNAEAKAYIDSYMARYPGVAEYLKKVVEDARKCGYVETLFKRRRYIPELKSSNFNLRSFGERVALNTPIQGTAADIIKLAMINVYRRLKTEIPSAKMILQVHDEIIVECPEKHKHDAEIIIREEMEKAVSYRVPMMAEVNFGSNWSEAH